MIKALIAGERDPRILAALARGRMKAKHDDLVEALDGMFDDHHGELAQLLLDQSPLLDRPIAQLSARAARADRCAIPAAWGINADGDHRARSRRRAGCLRAERGGPAGGDPRHQPGPGPGHHRRDRPGHDPVPHRRPPGVLGRATPVARQSGPRSRAGKKARATPTCAASSARPPPAPRRTATFLGERLPPARPPPRQSQGHDRRRPLHPGHHLAPAPDPDARYTDLGPGYYHARTRHRPQDPQPPEPTPCPHTQTATSPSTPPPKTKTPPTRPGTQSAPGR